MRPVLGAAGDRRQRHARPTPRRRTPTARRRSSVRLHDNGGTANGGEDTSADADLHDHRDGRQRRPVVHQGGRPDGHSRTPGADGRRLGDGASRPARPNEAGQTLTFLVTQRQQRPCSRRPAGDRRQRHADLHPGGQRQRQATVSACDARTTAARPTAARTRRPMQTFTITVTAVNDVPVVHQGRQPDGRGGRRRADGRRLGHGDHRRPGQRDRPGADASSSRNDQHRAVLGRSRPIAANGTLTYTPAANANGAATVSVRLHGQRRHGQRRPGHLAPRRPSRSPSPRSTTRRVFTKGADQTRQRGRRAADGRRLGHGDLGRPGQRVGPDADLPGHAATPTRPCSRAQPAIAANGTLTYTPAANANGTATVTVQVCTTTAGRPTAAQDTSAAQTFTITVTAVNDAPSASPRAPTRRSSRTPARRRWPAGPRRSRPVRPTSRARC